MSRDLVHPCPACEEVALVQAHHGLVPFLRCPRCDGAFMREVRLGEYVEAVSGSPAVRRAFWRLYKQALREDEESPRALRRCCVCRQRLDRFGFGERPFLIADRCEDHGVWLDAHDRERIVRAAQATASVEAVDDPEPDPEGAVAEVQHVMRCPNCARDHPGASTDARCEDCGVLMLKL